MRSAALVRRKPIDFHTSNIQRARMKRLALCIVRLGNPIGRPPKGRFSRDARSVNGTQNQNAFSGATALFAFPAPLFSPFFSGKTEKNGPSEATCAFGASEMGLRRKKARLRRANKKTVAGQAYDGWQGMRDSNPRKRSQSPVCYRYTNPLFVLCVKTQVLLY